MQAMILAAGLGTRLRPLTNDRPKALVEVGGVPMLERVANQLVQAGAKRLVINVHHFADRVVRFVNEHDGFGAEEVYISREVDEALETGGGIKHAREYFDPDEPFLVHNVDILTDLNLRALMRKHISENVLATLATRPAETHRVLLFDQQDLLCGYGTREDGELITIRKPQGEVSHVDFMGIQVISPRIFRLMEEEGVFSIINVYMRLLQEGEDIQKFDASDAVWQDIGTHERLEEAGEIAEEKGL